MDSLQAYSSRYCVLGRIVVLSFLNSYRMMFGVVALLTLYQTLLLDCVVLPLLFLPRRLLTRLFLLASGSILEQTNLRDMSILSPGLLRTLFRCTNGDHLRTLPFCYIAYKGWGNLDIDNNLFRLLPRYTLCLFDCSRYIHRLHYGTPRMDGIAMLFQSVHQRVYI